MQLAITTLDGNEVDNIELHEGIFNVPYKADVIKCVIDWQLAKRRAYSAAVKTMSDVSGTTAKPFRQKGTGKARQGSLRAPHFRGGGIVFGPTRRSYGWHVNRKVRLLAIKAALSYKAKNNKIYVLKDLSSDISTKEMRSKLINRYGIDVLLFFDSASSTNVRNAMLNVSRFNVLPIVGLNVYDIMCSKVCVFTVNALEELAVRLKINN